MIYVLWALTRRSAQLARQVAGTPGALETLGEELQVGRSYPSFDGAGRHYARAAAGDILVAWATMRVAAAALTASRERGDDDWWQSSLAAPLFNNPAVGVAVLALAAGEEAALRTELAQWRALEGAVRAAVDPSLAAEFCLSNYRLGSKHGPLGTG